VCLERHDGLEHTVVAVPGVTCRSEAIRLADTHCRAEHAAYPKEVTAILRSHGVLELFNKLNRLKAEKDVVVILGRAPTPPEGPRITRCAATREEAEEIERARPVAGTIYNKW